MTAKSYLSRRNAYAYPAVGLSGTRNRFEHQDFPSILAMEQYHRALLRSADDDDVVLGYLSVVYWGHYSGQQLRPKSARAKARVKLANLALGRGGAPSAAATVRRAVQLVDAAQFGQALVVLSALPQLGFAFASKVCVFISPDQCGVIDSVIASRHPRFAFACDSGGFVRHNAINAVRYDAYCSFLRAKAEALNTKGSTFRWLDRDGTRHKWRAVDVERAMYEA